LTAEWLISRPAKTSRSARASAAASATGSQISNRDFSLVTHTKYTHGASSQSSKGTPMPEAHIDPTREQFDAFKALPRDAPIAMLNLVRYRERAAYPGGHDCAALGLTGAEAYARYGAESGPIFRRVGGSVIWSGAPQLVLTGPADEAWDTAFVALYPDAHAFLEMVTDPAYRLAVVHRQAAVATSRLIRCEPREAGGGFA